MGKVGIRDDKFKLRPDEELYIACETYDFSFFKNEVQQVKQCYKEGVPLPDIARKLNRHQVEIAILIMDLAEKGRLHPRPTGAY